jgi:hypothetical protein
MRDDEEVMENPYLQSRGVGCFERRDTRPIMPPWQRVKAVKMMKSLTGSRR